MAFFDKNNNKIIDFQSPLIIKYFEISFLDTPHIYCDH